MIFMNKKTNWYKLAAMSIGEAYDILGLKPGVDQKTLRQTLRQKRRELHPDVNRDNPNAELQFQLTEQAAKLISQDITGIPSTGNISQSPDVSHDYYAFGHFSDERLNQLWAKIEQNSGSVWTSINSIPIEKNEVSKKIAYGALANSVSYYDWNAVFEDYDFMGVWNYGDVGTYGKYYEVALGKNGNITAQASQGGVYEDISNELLADAINDFYSLVMELDEQKKLTPMDYSTFEDLGGGDIDLSYLDNTLFDLFGSSSGDERVDYIDVYPFNHALPTDFKNYDGFIDYYCIPPSMSYEEFRQHIEAAKSMGYDNAYTYLFSQKIYLTKDIWDNPSDVLYEWFKRQEDFFKTMASYQSDSVEEWYRKMKYIKYIDESKKAVRRA